MCCCDIEVVCTHAHDCPICSVSTPPLYMRTGPVTSHHRKPCACYTSGATNRTICNTSNGAHCPCTRSSSSASACSGAGKRSTSRLGSCKGCTGPHILLAHNNEKGAVEQAHPCRSHSVGRCFVINMLLAYVHHHYNSLVSCSLLVTLIVSSSASSSTVHTRRWFDNTNPSPATT